MARKRKSSPCKIEVVDRQRRALEMRRAGLLYESIANANGQSSAGSAYRDVQAALRAVLREPAEAVRQIELDRLDRLQLAIWARALNGDSEAIDRVLKIQDRRARLLGLDAPAKIDHTSAGESIRPRVIEIVHAPEVEPS